MERVDVEGLTIAFERRGQGPPLVLAHGGMIDHREWAAQLDGLSDAFTVVAWDAPGCGASSDPPGSFRMPDYGRALIGLIERLALDRPHLGGLSWGSTLALEVVRQRPDLPRSLVLTGAYAGWAGSLPPDEVQARLSGFLGDIERPPEAWMPAFLETLLTDDAPEAMRASLLETMADASRPTGLRPMLLAMAEADLRGVLPTIGVPTLLLNGERDVRSSPEVAEEMQRSIPGSRLVLLSGAGHQSNIEFPVLFNDAVRSFLIGLA